MGLSATTKKSKDSLDFLQEITASFYWIITYPTKRSVDYLGLLYRCRWEQQEWLLEKYSMFLKSGFRWFHDTALGGCRSPKNWSKFYVSMCCTPNTSSYVLRFNASIFSPAGCCLMWCSSVRASLCDNSLLAAINSTGRRDCVYFEPFPALCFSIREVRSFVIPQYNELSAHFTK